MEEKANSQTTLGKTLVGVGYFICVVLALVFIINVTMIVKSYTHPG